MMASSEDRKRGVAEISEATKPLFPEGDASLYSNTVKRFEFRDNSECLSQLGDQSLFLRPTQMGKSSLLDLAYFVYDKKTTCPDYIKFQPDDKNSKFVFNVSFMAACGNDARTIDENVLDCVQGSVINFFDTHDELKNFNNAIENPTAGKCLRAVARAVSQHGSKIKKQQALLVLVDEYDKPVRELLIRMIGTDGEKGWEDYRTQMVNYRSFFAVCKDIVENKDRGYSGLKDVKVWITGVIPVALNLISGYNPTAYTFREKFASAIGVLGKDVDSYLNTIHQYLPFRKDEMAKIRGAVKNLANRLYFTNPNVPVYHTRIVNGMMAVLTDKSTRDKWLNDLSRIPPGIEFQSIPNSVFDIIKRQGHPEIREVARKLSLNEEIESPVNYDLKLDEIVQSEVKVKDYLTLLAHLGIASFRKEQNGRTIFQATSVFFRIPFFERLLGNSMQPLLDASDLKVLYGRGEINVQEFMRTLPKSGMSSLIRWANLKRQNKIMDLQFQAYLISQLSESLWDENVETSQEDMTSSGQRTDVRIANHNTIIVLELKQTPSPKLPNTDKMKEFHQQLSGYMVDIVEAEKAKPTPRQVAGFLVVMYNNGTLFEVQKTTYTGNYGNQ